MAIPKTESDNTFLQKLIFKTPMPIWILIVLSGIKNLFIRLFFSILDSFNNLFMKSKKITLLALIISFIAGAQSIDKENVVSVPHDDLEMTIAMVKARSTFSDFLEAFVEKAAGVGNFMIKYPFEKDGSYEHLWLDKIGIESEHLIGFIGDKRMKTEEAAFGEKVKIAPYKISDWMYFVEGKMTGGYTLLVLLDRKPEDEKMAMKKTLGIE
jgi:uncharacterized protein YegJ (DUF2314 family)